MCGSHVLGLVLGRNILHAVCRAKETYVRITGCATTQAVRSMGPVVYIAGPVRIEHGTIQLAMPMSAFLVSARGGTSGEISD